MSSAQVAVAAAVAAFTGLAFMNWRDKVNGKQLEKKKYEVRAFRQHQRPGADGSSRARECFFALAGRARGELRGVPRLLSMLVAEHSARFWSAALLAGSGRRCTLVLACPHTGCKSLVQLFALRVGQPRHGAVRPAVRGAQWRL